MQVIFPFSCCLLGALPVFAVPGDQGGPFLTSSAESGKGVRNRLLFSFTFKFALSRQKNSLFIRGVLGTLAIFSPGFFELVKLIFSTQSLPKVRPRRSIFVLACFALFFPLHRNAHENTPLVICRSFIERVVAVQNAARSIPPSQRLEWVL